MFRQTKIDDPDSDKASEVAAVIAEEGLRYVNDTSPGYRRKRVGKSFSYFDKDNKRITNADVLRRIKSIGIPPAYEAVWICPSPNGHIQATGLDARGRKQYRYHPKWREIRDQDKYEHIMEFAAALPDLRRHVSADFKRDRLPREKVLATIVSLLEKTLIRVGNNEYAAANKSYGLTTMRRKHVEIKGSTLRFEFTGKSGKQWKLQVQDKRIVAIVKRCADIPGHELFKYLDDEGQAHTIDSATLTPTSKKSRSETSLRKTSAPGPGQYSPLWRWRSLKNTTLRPKPNETWSRRSIRSRSSLATHGQSVANATSTLKFLMPICPAIS